MSIDYYFTPQSPWTYLGHNRLMQLAAGAGARVRVMPVDFGKIFPISGGLPLPKRAPQRQAYRLVDLQRFSDHLQIPLNREPMFFPVAGDPAARLITAVDLHDGSTAAMALSAAILRGVWAEQRDIADPATLAQLLAQCGLPAQRLAQSQDGQVQQRYDEHTAEAVRTGVFGAPTYGLDGELFWGQDRLEFLERKLASR